MDLFAKATKIAPKATGKAKTDKKEIAIAGIQSLAEIKAMMTSLEAAAKTIETEIKTAGFAEFLAMETTVRPESFKGTDGLATASVEMRKRGTNSALNGDECNVLEQLGLKPFKQVITTEMFGINPVFAADKTLMGKVSKALEKIVPEGFIVLQEEASKMVVDDTLLDAAFKLVDEDKRKVALEIVTTMALKPKLDAEYDMSKLFDNVKAYLEPVGEEVVEAPVAKVDPVVALEAEGAALVAAGKKSRKAKTTA